LASKENPKQFPVPPQWPEAEIEAAGIRDYDVLMEVAERFSRTFF
jgi:hypothetical protein